MFKLKKGVASKILANDETLMIVENMFEKGGIADVHSHVNNQAGYVLTGKFEVSIGKHTRVLEKGDSFTVSSEVPHSCIALESGIILDIFSPLREDLVLLQNESL